MDSIEVSGATIEEAVAVALQQLGSSRENVAVEVLESPSRGLLGLGARSARVRVTTVTKTPVVDAAAAVADTSEPSVTAVSSEVSPVANAAVAERAAEVLRGIVERVGVDASVAIRPHEDGILLELLGDTSGILIGRHGQMLDALEYVVNRALLRDDENAARVVVDANDYRVRRRTSLEDLARRMAEQAKRTRKPMVLDPMPPQDRRIIHLALQGDPSLTTKSSGTGVLRRLVIIPEGAAQSALDFE